VRALGLGYLQASHAPWSDREVIALPRQKHGFSNTSMAEKQGSCSQRPIVEARFTGPTTQPAQSPGISTTSDLLLLHTSYSKAPHSSEPDFGIAAMVNVAIPGGTGGVGRSILDAVHDTGKHKVIALSRKVSSDARLLAPHRHRSNAFLRLPRLRTCTNQSLQ
jgi:hypothetical protein